MLKSNGSMPSVLENSFVLQARIEEETGEYVVRSTLRAKLAGEVTESNHALRILLCWDMAEDQ